MSRRAAVACALAAAFATGTAAHGARALEVRDDRGVTVSLPAPAGRIVALAPHLAEIAFAVGAGAKLVGVSSFSDFPDAARRLPVVFDWGRTDLERVLALRPDVVLAWRSGNPPLQIERLERLGLRVVVTEVRGFGDVPALMRLVGRLAGTEARADEEALRFEAEVARLRREYSGRRPVAVFLEIWHAPMITINGAHVFSEAIGLCGGRNVFAGAPVTTPLVSREQLLGSRPEAIVTGSRADREAWKGLEAVPAVRANRVYAVDADHMHRLGPRLVDGARELCRELDRARS
jgi:iron complex transport system substrate-binding protein